MNIIKIIITFTIFCVPSFANANLISYKSNGYDFFKSTNSNLEWLNLNYTAGQNWEAVDNRLDNGDLSNLGLRYASFDESLELFSSFYSAFSDLSAFNEWDNLGITKVVVSAPTIGDKHLNLFNTTDVNNFIAITGSVYSTYSDFRNIHYIFGSTQLKTDSMYGTRMLKPAANMNDTTVFQQDPLQSTNFDLFNMFERSFREGSESLPNYNHLLVRAALSVPEPTTLMTFILGILLLSLKKNISRLAFKKTLRENLLSHP
jgi:hypothetical protein